MRYETKNADPVRAAKMFFFTAFMIVEIEAVWFGLLHLI